MKVQTLARRFVAVAATGAMLAVPIATASTANAAGVLNSGFEQPFAGVERYLPFAPKEVKRSRQINKPLGQAKADALAAAFGFDKDKAMSKRQFRLFVSGRGKGPWTGAERAKAAELVDISTMYLTNTTANPMYRNIDGVRTEIVLGSYGLIVDKDGMLSSPANDSSPVRQVNWVLAPNVICDFPEISPPPGIPCGYMGTWMRKNGAKDTLKELYASAYTAEAVYGSRSQGSSEPWELVTNTRADGSTATVGMAMAPSIWVANFLLIYSLNPELAANMPARWAAIPAEVAEALYASDEGKIPYAEVQQYFD